MYNGIETQVWEYSFSVSFGSLREIFPPFVSSEAFIPDMVVNSPVLNTLLMYWPKRPNTVIAYISKLLFAFLFPLHFKNLEFVSHPTYFHVFGPYL